MPNGKHRDSVRTDILLHGIPTLSPEADDLFKQVAELSDVRQSEALERTVNARLASVRGPSVSRWFSPPWIFLGDLEPESVGALTSELRAILAERQEDGRRRGWEID